MEHALPPALLDAYLYFAAMAFAGWIIETLYRSFRERRFVNAGFLSGPFVPIYGFGALIISLIGLKVEAFPAPAAWAVIVLSPTVLEYLGSLALEKLFGLSLWDYRDQAFNLKGRVCLRFSLYWAILAVAAKLFIEPAVLGRIRVLGPYYSHFAAGFLTAYFALDLNHSIRSVFNFKAFLADLSSLLEKGGTFLPAFHGLGSYRADGRLRVLPAEVRRLFKPLSSFPALRRAFVPTLSVFPDWIRERLEKRFGKKGG